MDVDSEIKQRIHDQEVRRMRDTYGPDAEMPRSPYGNLTLSAPSAPVAPSAAARISELSKQLADAAHALAEARFRGGDGIRLVGDDGRSRQGARGGRLFRDRPRRERGEDPGPAVIPGTPTRHGATDRRVLEPPGRQVPRPGRSRLAQRACGAAGGQGLDDWSRLPSSCGPRGGRASEVIGGAVVTPICGLCGVRNDEPSVRRSGAL
jgi:hypothetical protein